MGGVAGAQFAARSSSAALQWTYLAYLVGLDILLIVRPAWQAEAPTGKGATRASRVRSLAVGGVAGFSSGLLGIGGGLAITAGLSAGLKPPQHQAQPRHLAHSNDHSGRLRLLAAWVADILAGARRCHPRPPVWHKSWALMANRSSAVALRHILLTTVAAMAIYMTHPARLRDRRARAVPSPTRARPQPTESYTIGSSARLGSSWH
jgi:uncharacterized protein